MYSDCMKDFVETKEKIEVLEKINHVLREENAQIRIKLEELQQVVTQQQADSSSGIINVEALCTLANGLLVQQPICVSICIGEQSEVYLDGDD